MADIRHSAPAIGDKLENGSTAADVTRRQKLLTVIYFLLISTLLIGLCSRSSPLYPFNNWNDANCFFTTGKAMFSGKVVYRDIYEQKGILLYFLYGLCYLISGKTFLGVYILEVLCLTGFLALAYDSALLFLRRRTALILMPIIAAVLCGSYSFYYGGSVEELELALVYLPIYCMLKSYFKSGDCIPSPRGIFILGASAACLLWSKFTLLGIYIGYVVFTAVLLIKRRDWNRFGCAAGMFVCGAAAASLPWIIYFAVNNALGDMFTVYFYNNLFLYAEERSLFKYLFYLGGAFYQNMLFLVIAIVGAVAVIRSKYAPAFKWGMFSLYFCNVFFIYVGGIAFEYYAYGMAALSVFGFIVLAGRAEKLGGAWREKGLKRPGRQGFAALAAVTLLCAAGFAHCVSFNSFYMKQDRDELWLRRFADEIAQSEEQTLLNYGSLDLGLYTETGIVPVTRFFCKLNIPLDEMFDEMNEAVRTRRTEWLVCYASFEDNELINENYDLVCKASGFEKKEDDLEEYCLFRRKAM